jgi:serine phosphatase RsbU (regulator of sigma subunit)
MQFNISNQLEPRFPRFFPTILFISLIFFTYLFYQNTIARSKSINIPDLLWKVFVTGLIATLISLAIIVTHNLLEGNYLYSNIYYITAIYQVNLAVIVIYLVSTYVAWKRLILYQKSRRLIFIWRFFQYALVAGLFLSFTKIEFGAPLFNICWAILILIAIVLSVNLKWVPYLNFKQKWKSMLLNLLIALYLVYFLNILLQFPFKEFLISDLINNLTILSLFSFLIIYAVFAILVTLFNLPTSSVFEQKLEEVLNFQRLSQSRNTDHDEEQVYDILLESSVSAVLANAAWLEIYDDDNITNRTIYHNINSTRKEEIQSNIDQDKISKLHSSDPVKNLKTNRFVANLDDSEFKSILVFPLYVYGRHLGLLVLLKDLSDAFNREMIEIIRTFVNQACISIENYHLLSEAIENERYKEELEIAKRVQGSLLPEILIKNEDFDISAFTKAAAEVGGDYYDTYRIDENRVALIIGDVSGKGTSAAFHMSQMKGIFQSLVQLDLPPKKFIGVANHALGNCLDRTSFITTSFFVIDQTRKEIEFTRAGHCPTLIYEAENDEVVYLEDSGLGLGILRDDQFEQYIDVNRRPYKPGDIVLLYTDGITEAKNVNNEEFGFQRLKEYLQNHSGESPAEIERGVLKTLTEFCGTKPPDDDFTLLIIKFK